jgi:hypothetical protein
MVIVIEPVHGNDTVIVIRPWTTASRMRRFNRRGFWAAACSSMGNDHAHGIVPVPVHVKDHGDDHAHDHDHAHDLRHELVMNREPLT